MVVIDDVEELQEPVPSAAGAELEEWLPKLEDYVPTIPDALTMSYFHSAGFESVDPRFARFLALSAQMFISDIANDALVHCKSRSSSNQHSGGNKDKKLPNKKYVLQIEDLLPAISDHGITVRKAPYFV